MFLEPYYKGQRSGWIEVICGSMFSGKTEELLRRLKRAQIANQKIAIFKPLVDNRYHDKHVVSHDDNYIESKAVAGSKDIPAGIGDATVVGIDEIQFFDDAIVGICEGLAAQGKRVIVAGLDMDFKGKPFGPMPALLAVSEYITKLHAICPHCGNLATHSYRLVLGQDQVMVGEKESYEPRCRACYNMGNILHLR